MVEYAQMKGAGDDAEDVVQEVFADLAKVFRAGRYAHEKGKFKAYLAKMLRNELVNRFRRREVRPERNSISVTEVQIEIVETPETEETAAEKETQEPAQETMDSDEED